jgi:hypothetical protein
MFTSRVPLIRPAARPDTKAPSIIPLIMGMKNQPNWRSSRRSRSSTNAGAEAMYRNSAAKLNAPAAARRWKRGLSAIQA